MFIGSLVGWWYGRGWKDQSMLLVARLTKVNDFFSIGLLASSLFAPFRQISNDQARPDASLDAQLRIWGDRVFSRFIGAFMRSILIIAGGVTYVLAAFSGILWLLLWPLLPVMPVIIGFWTLARGVS